jgi:hypothetical protein
MAGTCEFDGVQRVLGFPSGWSIQHTGVPGDGSRLFTLPYLTFPYECVNEILTFLNTVGETTPPSPLELTCAPSRASIARKKVCLI